MNDSSFPDRQSSLSGQTDGGADEVFDRFARRLVGLARSRLDRKVRQKIDPEDVVQSVFRSFFSRHAQGQFQINDWDDMWHILVVITIRKCGRKAERFHAARRDVDREVSISQGNNDDWQPRDVVDREPTPDEVACLIETVEQLMSGANPVEREIILMRLQGHGHLEISEQIGNISERKVYRVLAQARKRLGME